ncbi:MAG TPA: family 43 glycosylhydrolase [Clostridiales bacterium]|nr:family 43 glycosylhydrolase [Clostridiales bacterium]
MSEILWCADNGDGTYRNPVLYCDYSDPDAICVNGTYYLTASTFNYVPGLPILTSRDLVNWKLRNYAVKNIPEARYAAPQHAQGIWAPAIRFQNGRFYIYYGMPDEGIYMVSTENPLGDWDTPVLVKPGKGLIDPCPFWDDDGRTYIIHGYAKSRIGFKSWLGIFPISPDGRTALGDDHLLYDGTKRHPTIEGPKVHKRGGWYYIFAPAGGVATGVAGVPAQPEHFRPI